MATPPPEATSLPKEDKPQLPPSPNGLSNVDVVGDKGTQNAVVTDADTNETAKLSEAVVKPPHTAEMNGHTDNQVSHTNGDGESKATTNGSALVSPENTVTDSASQEPSAVKEEVAISTPNIEPTTSTTETVQDVVKENSTSNELSSQEAAKDQQTQQNASQPSAPSTDLPPKSDVPKAEEEAPPVSDASASNANMPLHQAANKQTDATPGNNNDDSAAGAGITQPTPTSQDVDQDMRDASVPPTKISRERDDETGDEPAAKRTKVEDVELKPVESAVPKLPTPATEAPVVPPADGEPMTKVQHKFLVKSIASLRRMHDSRFYREPVDPVKMNIPQYFDVVKNPMDLGTIERKLKSEQYRTSQSLIDDFNLMVNNAVLFNSPQHLVAQEGLKLRGTFEKQMTHLPKADVVEDKKSKKAKAPRRDTRAPPSAARTTGASPQNTTFALGPEGLPLIRRDSTTADGRPKRSIHPPKRDIPYSTKPKKKKYQWELKFCQETLDELHKTKYYNFAAPFYYPVDPVALNIPSYHSVIKKPMDLSTMQTKLRTGQYENAKEFELDMRLMFKNCFKFNLNGDPTYVAGQQLQELFDKKWSQKRRYLEAHDPQPGPQANSSDEENNSDEPDSDGDQNVVSLLQKQIAEMSRQVDAIQKKKKTPPASKKASKAKVGKKEPNKSGGKDKKAAPKAKPEKPRWVTYQEKQLISSGISNLPDKKMQEALKIIQNNVPALKGTQETEIELDIDELPNDVLLMLLKFVKKNAPNLVDDEEPAAPAANVAPPKPKKNKPMSKHEQEAQINMLESNLSRFQGGTRSPDPVPSVEANESSDESDDTEESEEE